MKTMSNSNNCDSPLCRRPETALAWSEALANSEPLAHPLIALWQPHGVYAALGLSQTPEKELVLERFDINLIRRQSGGGAVLLYPGVLCWEALAATAHIDAVFGKNAGIRPAYDFLCRPVVEGLATLGIAAFRAGISDLSVAVADGATRKIAGTAQYRRRENVLVHGALLVFADIGRMSRYLAFPSSQPEYRRDRTHRDFCVSLAELSPTGANGEALLSQVARAVAAAAADKGWRKADMPDSLEGEALWLENNKYRDYDWNWRKKRPNPPSLG